MNTEKLCCNILKIKKHSEHCSRVAKPIKISLKNNELAPKIEFKETHN